MLEFQTLRTVTQGKGKKMQVINEYWFTIDFIETAQQQTDAMKEIAQNPKKFRIVENEEVLWPKF